MNIKIESGAKVQITNKPIINVFGDVNIGENSKNYSDDVVDAEYEEEGDKVEEQTEQVTPEEEKLNYTTPRIVLQNMLQKDWYDTVCTDKHIFNKEWRIKLVADLMVSEFGASIAKRWKGDSVEKVKGGFLGTLSEAKVLVKNKSEIARAYLGIDKNTRDKDDKKEASTFANYMGLGKDEPYADWIKDYVEQTKQTA
jgi:hypothetical protein